MASLELDASLEGKMLLKNLTCCAKCNKTSEPFEELKMCTDCRSVWYCTVDCQKAHRSSHKEYCKREKMDIKGFKDEYEIGEESSINVARDDDDDNLFNFTLPAMDDCPICFVPLPIRQPEVAYKVCCGQDMCCSCHAESCRIFDETNSERTRAGQPRLDSHCAYCGQLDPRSDKETEKYIEKRMRENDAGAFLYASRMHLHGNHGVPKDPQRGFDLCRKSTEIGTCNADALLFLADHYQRGVGVQQDMTKARHYNVLAAKAGNFQSRFIVGGFECRRGNLSLAIKHWLIAASIGGTYALRCIAWHYKFGFVSKEEYKNAILNHRKVHKTCWSEQRERWKQANPINNDESNVGF